jgi:hypothetical protein
MSAKRPTRPGSAVALISLVSGCASASPAQQEPQPRAAVAETVTPPEKEAQSPVTVIDELRVGIRCAGRIVSARGERALVACDSSFLTVMQATFASTLDEAISAMHSEMTTMLRATITHEDRSEGRYRVEYLNRGGDGTNYWADVVHVFDDRVFLCRAGMMKTPEDATHIGDICESLFAVD